MVKQPYHLTNSPPLSYPRRFPVSPRNSLVALPLVLPRRPHAVIAKPPPFPHTALSPLPLRNIAIESFPKRIIEIP